MALWIGVLVLALGGLAFCLEIYFHEGVYLGPHIQSWLYEQWAMQYDMEKQRGQDYVLYGTNGSRP